MHSDPYTDYYLKQAGSGISHVYAGTPWQKGHGLGSFLAGLFRSAIPIFKSGAKYLGRELLSTGGDVLHDIASDRKSPKEAFKSGLRNVASRMGKYGLNNLASVGGGKRRKRRKKRRGVSKARRGVSKARRGRKRKASATSSYSLSGNRQKRRRKSVKRRRRKTKRVSRRDIFE